MLLALFSLAFAGETPERYHYKGPGKVCFCTFEEVVGFIREKPEDSHKVWLEGWTAWKPWAEVPELKAAVGGGWSWSGPDGTVVTGLSTSELSARLAGSPGPHLVWKSGMGDWVDPASLPELAGVVAEAPPPLPSRKPVAEIGPAPDRSEAPAPPEPGPRKIEAVELHLGNFVEVGAEARVLLEWADLQDAGLDEGSVPSFRVERLRPEIVGHLAPWATARASLWIRQTDEVVELADENGDLSEAEIAPLGFAVEADDVYLDLRGGGKVEHHARFGASAPIFGGIESFEERWLFGGTATWEPAVVRAGLVPYRDVGLSYGLGTKAFSIEVQGQNGGGVADLDPNAGKDLSGRLQVRAGELLLVEASGLYGPRAARSDATLLVGHLAADLTVSVVKARAEAWFGHNSEGGLDAQPFGAHAAIGLDMDYEHPVIRGVDVEGRFQLWDPDFVDDDPAEHWPDSTWLWGAALNVHFRTDHEARHDLYAGLVFEDEVPEVLTEPEALSLTLQTGWRF